ncbi:hypothetical protein [Rhodococcoides fascians]|uniref:hypothetical protein n=1 Tax=Rhodococcoides fascians TaxID=1828 RepID=UPI0027860089|nr:hypothetical protein [Rhodococcus fascians]MDQ0281280.1 hypothetical protein [Rhodococcus fascians]
MKWVRGVALMFGGPVVLIVGGTVWGPLMEWDLTQPQATLIAGLVAGPFLITAAYIAFHGQRENMKTEREKFNEQIKVQKEQARDELQLKRDQWVAEQRLINARNVRDRDSALFARMLAFYAEFARAVGRTKRAIPRPAVVDPEGSWALVDSYLVDAIAASNSENNFLSELRLAGYDPTRMPLSPVHGAMRLARVKLEQAVRMRLQGAALRNFADSVIGEFDTAFNDLTARAVAALDDRDRAVEVLADALESVDRPTGGA